MITFDEFVAKYTGEFVDYDGYYGAQCVDLMHFYIDEILFGSKRPEILRAPSAKEAYLTFNLPDLFEKIDNTPSGIPSKGDIVFWDNGKYGHVAICLEGFVSSFISFDQNFPEGTPCHKQRHDYSDVRGWLRFKVDENGSLERKIDALTEEIILLKKDRQEWHDKYDESERSRAIENKDATKHIESLQATQKEQNITIIANNNRLVKDSERIRILESSIQTHLKTIKSLQAKLDTLNSELETVTEDLKACELKTKKKLSNYSRWELLKEILFRKG